MRPPRERPHRIGVVGTGFIARGFVRALRREPGMELSRVLTRRRTGECVEFPGPDALTHSVQELIDTSDLVVEASGDVLHGTEVLDAVLSAALPAVTMNVELQVTTGTYLAGRGFLTEAQGDQPGCLAALREEIVGMGFRPLVYGNIKSFLNPDPTPDEMREWSRRQGLRLAQTVSFTDGTKIQFEGALVANALGADLAAPGMLGAGGPDLATGALRLAEAARGRSRPISDYVVFPGSPPGVFIVARHDEEERIALRNMRLGDGPCYVLLRSYHLCHLEIARTIRRVLEEKTILLNNSLDPTAGVVGIAKVPLPPGTRIPRGIGSFEVRGRAVRLEESRGLVPLGLLSDARVVRRIEPGQPIAFEDVDLPDSLALRVSGRR